MEDDEHRVARKLQKASDHRLYGGLVHCLPQFIHQYTRTYVYLLAYRLSTIATSSRSFDTRSQSLPTLATHDLQLQYNSLALFVSHVWYQHIHAHTRRSMRAWIGLLACHLTCPPAHLSRAFRPYRVVARAGWSGWRHKTKVVFYSTKGPWNDYKIGLNEQRKEKLTEAHIIKRRK